MPHMPFPAIPRVCVHCGARWQQRDGRPPRDYCTTSCRQEAERQARAQSGADEAGPPPPSARVYVRRVRAQVLTITCARCGATVAVEQYPGRAPRYCGEYCRTAVAREGAAERMRQMRARRRQTTDSVTPSESA